MTKNWGFVFLPLLILAACTAPTGKPPLPLAATVTPTLSHRIIPTRTIRDFSRIPEPSRTPALSPTFAPTFDSASIITRTPAPPRKCPAPENIPLPDLSVDNEDLSLLFAPREEKVLDYLNQGGNPGSLIALLRQGWAGREIFTEHEVIKDLTGDGVPELLIIPSGLYIFGCENNQYKVLMTKASEAVAFNPIALQLVAIKDMNLNGIPEIVLANFGCGGMGAGQCLDVYIYEWDGNQFASLIPKWEGYTVGVSMVGGRTNEYLPDARIQDTDQNGTLELILSGGLPGKWDGLYYSYAPWRDEIDTYGWNGQYFVLLKTEFSAPRYRYQAVQDGDRDALRHEYDQALAFYQAAIFDDSLLGWSEAHRWHSLELTNFGLDPEYKLTPTPEVPPDDPQEYPNLAASARYRIMLLHILQGHLPEAQVVYETLQEKFPEGKDGHAFVLVARAFWDEYHHSPNLGAACASAISTADNHRDILKFLGSDCHGLQDMTYKPEDLCPFK